MSVWLTIPSKRPPEEARRVLDLWAERGYKIALFRDAGDPLLDYHLTIRGAYPGYAAAVNDLIRRLLEMDAAAEWFVVAGDDIEPDLNHTADKIAYDCGFRFAVERFPGMNRPNDLTAGTFGVMQPTGDRWGDEPWSRQRWPNGPAYIDRVLGSAWYGREYCRRMYGGRGPLFEGYTHMFEDEEAQNVALKIGVLWQRRDLIQLHRHWGRKPNATEEDCPDFLRKVNGMTPEGRKHWADSQLLFETRRDAGFPGHEPIP